nr:S41 family peptidase [Elizabethkingia sp. ASV34]
MKLFFPFLLLMGTMSIQAQNCNCKENYEWTKKTFEENDAGYRHILDTKGRNAYDLHNKVTNEKVANITDYYQCKAALEEWVKFFRTDHFRFTLTDKAVKNQLNSEHFQPVKQKAFNIEQFKKTLAANKEDNIEGIWSRGSNLIAVKKEGSTFVGSIINTQNKDWNKDDILFSLNQDLKSGTYYQRNFKPVPVKKVLYLGKNLLQIDDAVFQRSYPSFTYQDNTKEYNQIKTSGKTFGYKKDDNTVYLRIPAFHQNKKAIDSTLASLDKLITSTPNLIIDLRDCQGGQDSNYQGLIKYLYTNPIRTVMAEIYSTPQNNKIWDTLINSSDTDAEDKETYKKIQTTLNNKLGQFVNVFGKDVTINTQDKVLPYPKNVAVIIHENNFSTTEQFILLAKQSRKVKFFGRKTGGALDVSNMVEATPPSGDFVFEYCISRSLRIPELPVDDLGIHPDFYIDKTIPEDQWVDFTSNTMKNWN